MDISARAISLADRPQRAIRVTSVRERRGDPSSISSHPLVPRGCETSGAANSTDALGRFSHQPHAAVHVSPWPVRPGNRAVTSRSSAACTDAAAHCTGDRGSVARSTTATSATAKPSSPGRSDRRVDARSGIDSSRRRASVNASAVSKASDGRSIAWASSEYRVRDRPVMWTASSSGFRATFHARSAPSESFSMKRLDPSTSAANGSSGSRASAALASSLASLHRRCAKRNARQFGDGPCVGRALCSHGHQDLLRAGDPGRLDIVQGPIESLVTQRPRRRCRRRGLGGGDGRCLRCGGRQLGGTRIAWCDSQCPEARWFPRSQQPVERQMTRRSPGRVVNGHALPVYPDRNDIVVAERAVLEQEQRWPTCGEFAPQCRDGARESHRRPPAIAKGFRQIVVGDPSCLAIDKRCKLLHAGVAVAPIAKEHRRRRAAAERLGLRKVGDVE